MLTAEEMNRCMMAALRPDDPPERWDLPDTDEVREFIARCKADLDAMGDDVVADIPGEFPDTVDTDSLGLYSKTVDDLVTTLPATKAVDEGFTKAVGEHKFTLGPMYVPGRLDAHEEWTDASELQKAVWQYVDNGDRQIRLQHNRDIVAGRWSEIVTWPYEVTVPMHKADGTTSMMTFPPDTVFLGVHWEDWAWDLVKAGKVRGYSVGGRAKRIFVDLEGA